MRLNGQVHRRQSFLTLVLVLAAVLCGRAGEYVLWDKDQQRVDANVRTWDVTALLQRVAASTGWKIFLQPDTHQVVPSRFRNLAEGDALRRLLGDLNFALVPKSNAPPHLYVFRTSREDATQVIRADEAAARAKAKPIEDELIVGLKPGEKIEDLARRLGAKVLGKIDNLNAYRLKFDDADSARRARESLLKDPSVASVDYNYNIPRPESPDGIGLPQPRFNLQPKAPADGKYLVVGLIDSAVQPSAGRFGNFLLESMSVVPNSSPSTDEPTHGTAMAETILNGMASVLDKGAATTVRVLNVDVYGDKTTTSTFDVAAGLSKAIEAGARIINLSMASDGDSWVLHEVIKSAYAQNIPIFAAAGNEPVTTPVYPAAYPETVAVTARDRQGNIASYANRGDFVKASGPGTTLITFGDKTYYISGTSASTAWLSGQAAALAESTGQSMSKVVSTIQNINPVKRP